MPDAAQGWYKNSWGHRYIFQGSGDTTTPHGLRTCFYRHHKSSTDSLPNTQQAPLSQSHLQSSGPGPQPCPSPPGLRLTLCLVHSPFSPHPPEEALVTRQRHLSFVINSGSVWEVFSDNFRTQQRGLAGPWVCPAWGVAGVQTCPSLCWLCPFSAFRLSGTMLAGAPGPSSPGLVLLSTSYSGGEAGIGLVCMGLMDALRPGVGPGGLCGADQPRARCSPPGTWVA